MTIELRMDLIRKANVELDVQNEHWEHLETLFKAKIAQLKLETVDAVNDITTMDGVVSNCEGKLYVLEETIKKIISTADERTEIESPDEKIERIEARILDIQKEHVEMQDKANGVLAGFNNHILVYMTLYNVSTLMLDTHSYIWASWILATLLIGMTLQVRSSYSNIKKIGRKRADLINELTRLYAEAQTLGDTTRLAEGYSTLASNLKHSLSAFSYIFMSLLIIPVVCLLIICGGMIYYSAQNGVKANEVLGLDLNLGKCGNLFH